MLSTRALKNGKKLPRERNAADRGLGQEWRLRELLRREGSDGCYLPAAYLACSGKIFGSGTAAVIASTPCPALAQYLCCSLLF